MAKYRRFDPRNKKAERKNHRSEGRRMGHIENKYFNQRKNMEHDHLVHEDMEDYLEDHWV